MGDRHDVPDGITQDADPNAELFVPATAADLAGQATPTRAAHYNAHNQLGAYPTRRGQPPTNFQKNILAVNSVS